MGCVVPRPPTPWKGGQATSNPIATPRCSSVLRSLSADVRSTDDVTASEGCKKSTETLFAKLHTNLLDEIASMKEKDSLGGASTASQATTGQKPPVGEGGVGAEATEASRAADAAAAEAAKNDEAKNELMKFPVAGPITIGDLRAIRLLMDNTEDCARLEAALERCKGQARDNVERIGSVQSGAEVWSKWLGAGTDGAVNLEAQIEQWQEIAVRSMIMVDDLSSMIQYMPADGAEGRARNATIREDAELFLKSDPIASFVTKAAWSAEYPEMLGVISLLDNQELTFKTMWSRTVNHALEMDNAQIVCDQLQRFKEDITRHSLGASQPPPLSNQESAREH